MRSLSLYGILYMHLLLNLSLPNVLVTLHPHSSLPNLLILPNKVLTLLNLVNKLIKVSISEKITRKFVTSRTDRSSKISTPKEYIIKKKQDISNTKPFKEAFKNIENLKKIKE